ncbi:sugar kinase [Solitalea lacus]|uniref:sugar kinase n=1 Tax=Solitalea lacus TaxID=2911172 RepID=UPI001EDA7F11|nr:sugar kinase [Solitalea lacus]UKJ07442.1 sugar kinase [Solitalea lacus]
MITTFGEPLLRLSPHISKGEAGIYVGGSEANVCIALGTWGNQVGYISKLPSNELGHSIHDYLIHNNVNTDHVYQEGERVGIYFLMQGADLQHSSVIYDRNHSAFSQWKPGETDWLTILKGSTWFHWSAITPALNPELAQVCHEALKAAKELGLFISVDLNYRSKLWQYGKKPIDVMPQLVQFCDLIMGNIWAANTMLGTPLINEEFNNANKMEYNKAAVEAADKVFKCFPNCTQTAFTFRFSDAAEHTSLFATLNTKTNHYLSNTYISHNVIDRVGSGDAFMAGLIYGFSNKWEEQQILEFAVASAYCKWHILGDHTTASVKQIMDTSAKFHETYSR